VTTGIAPSAERTFLPTHGAVPSAPRNTPRLLSYCPAYSRSNLVWGVQLVLADSGEVKDYVFRLREVNGRTSSPSRTDTYFSSKTAP
jgi:hypothetical protein